jgi:hypothetical protein
VAKDYYGILGVAKNAAGFEPATKGLSVLWSSHATVRVLIWGIDGLAIQLVS